MAKCHFYVVAVVEVIVVVQCYLFHKLYIHRRRHYKLIKNEPKKTRHFVFRIIDRSFFPPSFLGKVLRPTPKPKTGLFQTKFIFQFGTVQFGAQTA